MRRLALAGIFVVAAAAVSVFAWQQVRGEERRVGALGSAKYNCPPWGPVLRVNAFGGKYCSAYDNTGAYVGRWASLDPAEKPCYVNPARPLDPALEDCCPDWAPLVTRSVGTGIFATAPKCTRYDPEGRLYRYYDPTGLYQGLYPAPAQPPKPTS